MIWQFRKHKQLLACKLIVPAKSNQSTFCSVQLYSIKATDIQKVRKVRLVLIRLDYVFIRGGHFALLLTYPTSSQYTLFLGMLTSQLHGLAKITIMLALETVLHM